MSLFASSKPGTKDDSTYIVQTLDFHLGHNTMVTKPCGALESPMATITKITRRRHENPPHGVATVKEWFNYVTAMRNEGNKLLKEEDHGVARRRKLCLFCCPWKISEFLPKEQVALIRTHDSDGGQDTEDLFFARSTVALTKKEKSIFPQSSESCRFCLLSVKRSQNNAVFKSGFLILCFLILIPVCSDCIIRCVCELAGFLIS